MAEFRHEFVQASRLQTSFAPCKLMAMPELPDITAYISALEKRIVGQPLERVRLGSPFLLRTVEPPLTTVEGRVVKKLRRVGKRIAIGLDGDLSHLARRQGLAVLVQDAELNVPERATDRGQPGIMLRQNPGVGPTRPRHRSTRRTNTFRAVWIRIWNLFAHLAGLFGRGV